MINLIQVLLRGDNTPDDDCGFEYEGDGNGGFDDEGDKLTESGDNAFG